MSKKITGYVHRFVLHLSLEILLLDKHKQHETAGYKRLALLALSTPHSAVDESRDFVDFSCKHTEHVLLASLRGISVIICPIT